MPLGKHDLQGQHTLARPPVHSATRLTDRFWPPPAAAAALTLARTKQQGLMKGYISHSHQLVVLSKDKPFPWYAPYRNKGQAFLDARAEREQQEREKVPTLPMPDAASTAAA